VPNKYGPGRSYRSRRGQPNPLSYQERSTVAHGTDKPPRQSPTPHIAAEYQRLQGTGHQMLDAAERAHAAGDRSTEDRCQDAADRAFRQAGQL